MSGDFVVTACGAGAEKIEMSDHVRRLIFEVCNDFACSRFPITEAIHEGFMASTGDRGKYPNALDSLARLALGRPDHA